MNTLSQRLACAILSVVGLSAGATHLCGQSIQLASGHVLVGEVQQATGDGLTFRRLDNGGVLELQWNDLTDHSATAIRRLRGLLVEDEAEVTVFADVIVFEVASGIKEEVVGRVVAENDTHFTVMRKGSPLEIERRKIKNRGKREVSILEIYTREEYYNEKVAEFAPAADPDKHVLLADALRRAGILERAEEHYLKAQELGGGAHRTQLPKMISRIRTLIESQAERELLAKIRHMRNRKEWEKAQAAIEEFEQTFADSSLMSELEREKRRYERERTASLADRIRNMWDRTILSVANDKVLDSKLSLQAARDYAENRMADDIFDQIGRALDVEGDEAKSLWQERSKYLKGRTIVFSYGRGSWVLGPDAVIKGTKAEKGEDDPLADSDDPELKRIIRLIQEQQRRSRQLASQRQDGEKETDESWWKSLKTIEKRQWLRAYFAEFGGQMEVASAHARPCENCDGKGTVTALGNAGRPQVSDCPVCHKTRFTRMIRAR